MLRILWMLRQSGFRLGPLGNQRGQDLVEYLVLVGVLALVVIAGVALFADEVQDWFTAAGLWFRGAPPPPAPGP